MTLEHKPRIPDPIKDLIEFMIVSGTEDNFSTSRSTKELREALEGTFGVDLSSYLFDRRIRYSSSSVMFVDPAGLTDMTRAEIFITAAQLPSYYLEMSQGDFRLSRTVKKLETTKWNQKRFSQSCLIFPFSYHFFILFHVSANEAAPEVEPEQPQELDLPHAIQNVLKSARIHGKIYRGLRECAKALDRNEAAFCILASNCDDASYTKLVTALCSRRELPVLQVESNEELGKWAGLCQIDKDGNPRKIVRCSCVVISQVGTDLQSYEYISEYIKKQNEGN